MKKSFKAILLIISVVSMSILASSCDKDDDDEVKDLYASMSKSMQDSIGISECRTASMTPIERPQDTVIDNRYGFEMWYASTNVQEDINQITNDYAAQAKNVSTNTGMRLYWLNIGGMGSTKTVLYGPKSVGKDKAFFFAKDNQSWLVKAYNINDKYIRVIVCLYAKKGKFFDERYDDGHLLDPK